jgi:hypothetical protein
MNTVSRDWLKLHGRAPRCASPEKVGRLERLATTLRFSVVLLCLIFAEPTFFSGLAQQVPAVPKVAAPITAVNIRILPGGMFPLKTTIKAGQTLIVARNSSSAPNLNLRLDRDKASNVSNVSMPKGKLVSEAIYNLTPGTYILSEVNHPNWTSTIVVTAK